MKFFLTLIILVHSSLGVSPPWCITRCGPTLTPWSDITSDSCGPSTSQPSIISHQIPDSRSFPTPTYTRISQARSNSSCLISAISDFSTLSRSLTFYQRKCSCTFMDSTLCRGITPLHNSSSVNCLQHSHS